MGLATVLSRAQIGIDARAVNVEVHITGGLPCLSIVGLPETVVRESKDRVRSAIQNSGFEFPARRITVNLAPADLPKEGGRFDLPIALGILIASGQLPDDAIGRYECVGELSLSGQLRPIRGAVSAAIAASDDARTLIAPVHNATEAALVRSATVLRAAHLLAVCAHLAGKTALETVASPVLPTPRLELDIADVRGQEQARRALELAATGRHSLLFTGPPGTGKSMLAQRLPGILPPMSERDALTALMLASLRGFSFSVDTFWKRPFRSPHHTCSAVALVGGGGKPLPGEVSLAHGGVLFLDELPEYRRSALEALREPLESGEVEISRARAAVTYPARFQLIAAMNPCPCGYLGDPRAECNCSSEQVTRYRQRISGPLMDRIDIHVNVPRINPATFDEARPEETSATIRKRVVSAYARQKKRQGCANAWLNDAMLGKTANVTAEARVFLDTAALRLDLSGRAYFRTIRLARTIGDLAGRDEVLEEHVAEALSLRNPASKKIPGAVY